MSCLGESSSGAAGWIEKPPGAGASRGGGVVMEGDVPGDGGDRSMLPGWSTERNESDFGWRGR